MKTLELNSIELFVVCEALEQHKCTLEDIIQTLLNANSETLALQRMLDTCDALLVRIKEKGRELT